MVTARKSIKTGRARNSQSPALASGRQRTSQGSVFAAITIKSAILTALSRM
jgi:hypothetical protein